MHVKLRSLLAFALSAVLLLSLTTLPQVGLVNAASEAAGPKTFDEQLLLLEEQIAGFAGYYYDDEGILNVYITAPSSIGTDQAKNILSDFGEDSEKGIILKQSMYSWKQWYSWGSMLNQYALEKENGILTLDINEKLQKIVIGVKKGEEIKQAAIEGFLDQNKIPREVILFREIEEVILESHGETISPLKGGVEIDAFVGIGGECTNGFMANSGNIRVGVTAGHCEIVEDLAGDQNFLHPAEGFLVGREVANTNPLGARYSDSLMWIPDAGVTTTLGKIYVSSSVEYTLTGKKAFPAQGEAICKMGRTEHEDCGTIINTGVNIFGENAAPYDILWSMAEAQYTSASGDSGGPIYKKGPNNSAVLYGIHRGQIVQGQTIYRVFSPISNIENDQGTLQVHAPGFHLTAAEQSSGNAVNGLNVVVLNPSGVQVANGFTPFSYVPTTTGTYTIRFNNYGNHYFTTIPSASYITDYNVYSWGGEVKVSVTNVNNSYPAGGIYYNHANPGNYARMTFQSSFTSGVPLNGMGSATRDGSGTYLTKGFTPFTVGLPTNQNLITSWNNWGTYYYQYGDTTATELSDVKASWGGEQTIRMSTNGAIYTDTGRYFSCSSPC